MYGVFGSLSMLLVTYSICFVIFVVGFISIFKNDEDRNNAHDEDNEANTIRYYQHSRIKTYKTKRIIPHLKQSAISQDKLNIQAYIRHWEQCWETGNVWCTPWTNTPTVYIFSINGVRRLGIETYTCEQSWVNPQVSGVPNHQPLPTHHVPFPNHSNPTSTLLKLFQPRLHHFLSHSTPPW